MVSRAYPAAAVLLLGAVLSSVGGDEASDSDLPALLERLADNAALYRTHALRFTSRETIRWVGDGTAGRAEFGYVYVYDESEGFQEYRTRYRKRPRKKAPKRVEPEAHGVPIYLSNAYLWCFTFRKERQERHEYSTAGTDRVDGIEAIAIRFVPVPPLIQQVNDWYGTAWVDPETAQPLKVEVFTPSDWVKREAVRTGTKLAGNLGLQRITTYFGERLDGLRMPSRVELRDERYVLEEPDDWLSGQRWTYRKFVRREVDQIYSEYRLFGVSAKDKIGSRADKR